MILCYMVTLFEGSSYEQLFVSGVWRGLRRQALLQY
jgi:hypothetical protein